ncbi:hypothetical protein [Arcobacter sp. FWKO B]|uniref:hypothetical protein n=1 Tax=Arcobacter sp. FWKO B TaxID=2593672 RepID=UPI0018A46E48|nr:hypothetical protein [Arcobacter sp. FWKO B]QOG12851.1 hypothetical protein FWKOB_09165 [Arcobacter sp. FWKO B]
MGTIANIMADKKTKDNTPALSEEQIQAGYISTSKYTKAQIEEAYNYLISSSQGLYFTDVYKENMTPQPYFTSTQEQYNNSNYNPNSTVGLVDSSTTFVPTVKVGQTFYNTGKVVTPYVVRQTGQVYDDVTLGIISQGNNVAPSLTNKYILDPYNSLKIIGGIEIANDVLNESMPATTRTGIFYNMYNNYNDLLNNINQYSSKNDD